MPPLELVLEAPLEEDDEDEPPPDDEDPPPDDDEPDEPPPSSLFPHATAKTRTVNVTAALRIEGTPDLR